MQGICAWLIREGHMKCNGIQGIYAQLTGGSICLLHICIVLDLAVGVASMQDIYAWLEGDIGICALFYKYRSAISCAKFGTGVFKASMLNWRG